jgi:hypothetical protein
LNVSKVYVLEQLHPLLFGLVAMFMKSNIV